MDLNKIAEGMVKAWKEEVWIPTYEVGIPEKNPIFLEKRVYQGSSGVVYPYPVIEKIADEKKDRKYQAVYLENEYLKIMILPELGGRVQMAYDKIKQRHFIYYNQVIKPALVGLTGPWVSGGIEFNWPQHHRPSTFLPIDWTMEEFPDGSITVWVSEMERMFHQKGMAGFTLYPGKAFLEIKAKLYNRTSIPQTFLWWANPAVAVNEYYQSVFPPDVNAVFDHGKRDVVSFPIATGTYYKVDYSSGVDISNYKNIPVPTSYMAVNSRFDFVGGYENDTQAGVLHVADHHISPGKKQWTWGNGDFGKAWDRNLTDEDGPYIELMAGVYTDNQPDFTWLQPYEEKSFVQYFLPYRELGVVKNANKDILLNIEEIPGEPFWELKVFVTSVQELYIVVHVGSQMLWKEVRTLSPREVLRQKIDTFFYTLDEVEVHIYNLQGREVLNRIPERYSGQSVPDAAKPALLPEEIDSVEQLYLTGLHLEQYRHATYSPADYYREALNREPGNVQNNNALGLWYLRHGCFAESETHLRAAIQTQLMRNPNPYDGEPLYNLGASLKYQGRHEEAYNAFRKACWNAAWQDAGYFACAQISTQKGLYETALEEIERSLSRNMNHHQARHLKILLWRMLGESGKALALIEESLRMDPFNYGARFERYLITRDLSELEILRELMRGESSNYEEVGLDYLSAGQYQEAVYFWKWAVERIHTSPMIWYYLAYAESRSGKNPVVSLEKAARHAPDYCFPNRLEDIVILEWVKEQMPDDAKAPYYLGNLWYDKRQYEEAVKNWELSIALDDTFPTVYRNLSLAYFNKLDRKQEAIRLLEKAFELDTTDARILMELDQLYKRVCRPHSERLSLLDKYPELVLQRDDLYLEQITLWNQTGDYEKAMERLDVRRFHPWEGGEGKVPAQYQIARVALAKRALSQNDYSKAIRYLEECLEYPPHLGEGKLQGAAENDFHYYLGCAYSGLGDGERAFYFWNLAAKGNSEPSDAIYYNDQKPDKIFYQGLALLKLDRRQEAEERFRRLIAYGEEHLEDSVKIDYFAVSLPDLLIWEDSLERRNKVHCNYIIALGYLGLGESGKAKPYFEEAIRMDRNHQGLLSIKSQIDNGI